MNKSTRPASDKIWSILKEVSVSHKDAKQEMQEIRASQKKTDEQMQKTSEQMQKTDKRIHEIVGDFGNHWGKLGENLVKGGLVQRLNERGIKVERIITNAKIDSAEFDIIAINGIEVVVVEVKATLDLSDVEKFTKDMQKFKSLWPEFKDKTIYGAMAFLIKANRDAHEIAKKQGFFVIEATGDVIIQNKEDFNPKNF